jgi:hypothetical protein
VAGAWGVGRGVIKEQREGRGEDDQFDVCEGSEYAEK